MATFSKQILSGSTNGTGITVVATATVGTTIHATGISATTLDEIWLYATNTSAATVKLTLEWGEATAPNGNIEINIGAEGTGLVLVAPGILLQNSLVVKAFAGTTNVVTLTGYVNRIS